MRRAAILFSAFSPSRFFLSKRQFDAIYIKAPTHKRAGFCFFSTYQCDKMNANAKIAFQFVRNIYAQDGTLLAGAELFNDGDGLDYVRIKGRNWATENGYELICNFDYVFEMNEVGGGAVFFYDVTIPDWCKSIILRQMPCVFTDKKTYKKLFPESTPFN